MSAAHVSRAGRTLREVAYGPDGAAWWSEQRPEEGGRTVVLSQQDDGRVRERAPDGFDASTAFHEYGGRCWTPLVDGRLVSVSWADQRLWLLGEGDRDPLPLTPDVGGLHRYCLPQPAGEHVLCLRERLEPERVRNELVLVPLDGSAALGDAVAVLWDGSDFVDAPRLSPDGRRLAFVTWDHPRMPWDGTELRVADLLGDRLGPVEVVLGGPEESVLQPEWDAEGLRAVSDASGWWNLVRLPGGVPL